MRGELVMSLVPCVPTGSSFFTPGFAPDSNSNSHSITLVHEECSDFQREHRSRSYPISLYPCLH